MKFENIPEKRIYPPNENPEVTKRKAAAMISLLEGQFDEIHPTKRPTILDFQQLSPNSTEKDFLKWIEREIGIKSELILDNGNTKESEKTYFILNHAYEQAKDFLKNTLKYTDEEISPSPDCPNSLSSKKDIFNILNKTIIANGKQNGLNKAFSYCRLTKAIIISYETLKNDAEMLKELTTSFENSLITSAININEKKAPLVFLRRDKKGKHFYAVEHGGLKGYINSRAKELQKIMLKFITREESNAETALKDGVASRITIEENQAVELVPILCKWLVIDKKVDFLNIENKSSYFSEEQVKRVEQLLNQVLSKNNFILKEEKSNHTSGGKFVALVIKGLLQSAEKENKFISLATYARQFEIQFISPFSKNEEDEMDHATYHVRKCIAARTRLDGGCPEHIFNEFVEDASRESGKSVKTIKSYLLEKQKGNPPSIIKMKKKDGRGKEFIYLSEPVYDRWEEFGWVDQAILSDIKTAKNKNLD